MAEKTLKSNPISDYLKKRQSEKPPKEEKRSRKEERERFKKRLASLTPAEQKYLKRKRAFDTVWPVCRALLVIGLCFVINIGCSIVQVITCAITGYGFGRFNFKGKNILFGVVIMMILVPSQIILIPQYMFFRYFNPLGIWHMIAGDYINLINSPLTMYMPAITANGLRAGLFIFLFRQSFRSLPKELEDAAYLDGCSPFRTFIKVMVPNAGSTFLTVFLLSVVWYWNDYYVSTSFFTDNSTIALQLKNLDASLTRILFNNGTVKVNARELIVWMEAGCLISITPILVMYIFLQKNFTEGIARSGLTGM